MQQRRNITSSRCNIAARHILEDFNTLFSGTEQLFNISLHVNSSFWDCGVIYTATELHIYALYLIFYADFNSKCLNR